MKGLQRFFLLVIFTALALEALGNGDTWSAFAWHFHADLSSWIGVRIVVSLLEILLIICAALWLMRARQRRPRWRIARGSFHWPLITLFALLAFGVLYGESHSGANLTVALWEIRGLAMMGGAYLLAGMFLRTEDDLDRFSWTVQWGATALAVTNLLRWAIVFRNQTTTSDLAYDHSDSMILAFALVLCVCQLLFGGSRTQRRFAVFAIPLYLICMGVMERRAAFGALAIGLVVCAIFLFRLRPRLFWRVFVPLGVLVGVYLVAFWHNQGFLGQPARAISSMFTPDSRDAASNLYRDLEKLDIQLNIQQASLTGLGFGQPFTFFIPLPNLSFWPFWHYMPHNSVLWLWMKDGIVGFFALWWLFGRAAYDGARVLLTQREQWAVVNAAMRNLQQRRLSARDATHAGASVFNVAMAALRSTTSATARPPSPPTGPASAPIQAPAQRTRPRPHSRRLTRRRRQALYPHNTVALLVAGVAMIPMLISFAYVDLGMTNERTLLLFGLLLGVIGRAPSILGQPEPPRKTRATRRRARRTPSQPGAFGQKAADTRPLATAAAGGHGRSASRATTDELTGDANLS